MQIIKKHKHRMTSLQSEFKSDDRVLNSEQNETPLRKSYGFVTLPKGTRLYHSSIDHLSQLPLHKPILFMVLHPSEWRNNDESKISVIELQRDVELLFMISFIKEMRIFSAINSLLGNERSNLEKRNYNNICRWLPCLQTEDFDGWFSSIDNKYTTEFAIVNNIDTLKLISCNLIKFNWNNSTYTNMEELLPKIWGTQYPISSLSLPIKMTLNSRFKSQIEAYQKLIEREDPDSTTFSMLLKNAEIEYFDADLNTTIRWV